MRISRILYVFHIRKRKGEKEDRDIKGPCDVRESMGREREFEEGDDR